MGRGIRRVGGTPIEEAPVGVLAILTVLLWLVTFPALVGLLDGLGLVPGGGWMVAAAAALLSLLVTVGLARQRRWRRPRPGEDGAAQTPLFARFSTWLWTTILVPNFLFGMLVIFRRGEGLGYLGALALGMGVSVLHAAFAWLHRRRKGEASSS